MSRLRLHRANRLTERSDYLRCYDTGRRRHTKSFLVFVAGRPDKALPWRFGMAVTKKTGSAVVRNRLRRLIRESFRLLQDEIAPGADYVVVPKKTLEPSSLGQAAVSAELLPLLQEAFRPKGA